MSMSVCKSKIIDWQTCIKLQKLLIVFHPGPPFLETLTNALRSYRPKGICLRRQGRSITYPLDSGRLIIYCFKGVGGVVVGDGINHDRGNIAPVIYKLSGGMVDNT